MKVYIAHNFAARDWLREQILPQFQAAGLEVTASWITDDSHLHSKNKRQSAMVDAADIDAAEAIVLFTNQFADRTGKGKFWELGYAYACDKHCMLIGQDDSCVFYTMPGMHRFASVDEVIAELVYLNAILSVSYQEAVPEVAVGEELAEE